MEIGGESALEVGVGRVSSKRFAGIGKGRGLLAGFADRSHLPLRGKLRMDYLGPLAGIALVDFMEDGYSI